MQIHDYTSHDPLDQKEEYFSTESTVSHTFSQKKICSGENKLMTWQIEDLINEDWSEQ